MKRKKNEVLNVEKLIENSELFKGVVCLLIQRYAEEQNENAVAVAKEIMGRVIMSR